HPGAAGGGGAGRLPVHRLPRRLRRRAGTEDRRLAAGGAAGGTDLPRPLGPPHAAGLDGRFPGRIAMSLSHSQARLRPGVAAAGADGSRWTPERVGGAGNHGPPKDAGHPEGGSFACFSAVASTSRPASASTPTATRAATAARSSAVVGARHLAHREQGQ